MHSTLDFGKLIVHIDTAIFYIIRKKNPSYLIVDDAVPTVLA